MKENTMPSLYRKDGDPLLLTDLSRQFNASQYGETLRQNVRFGMFKPEDTSRVSWEKLLGADVNNLNHLQLSLELTKSFLRHCANPDSSWQGRVSEEAIFSPQEQSTLQLTAIVHDWGEAVTGDIPFPKKTKADEEREMFVLRGVIHEIIGEKASEQVCEKIAGTVTDVLTDTTSKLGKAFNAIEHVGYVRTGLRAWEKAKKHEGVLQSNLQDLACDVVYRSISKVTQYSKLYPPVDAYATYHQDSINQIVRQTEQMSQYTNDDKFEEAKRMWRSRHGTGMQSGMR